MKAVQDLVVQAFPLASEPDLLDYFEPSSGFFYERRATAVVGVGAAATITVPAGPDQVSRASELARRALDRVARDADARPVVVGAVPFSPDRAATLVVPRIALVRRDGRTTMIVTGRDDMPEPETMPHEVPDEPWASLRVTPSPEPERYMAAVAEARRRIAAGTVSKVVLARSLLAGSDHEFDTPTLVERLRRVERECAIFGVGGFIGATPELLVERRGRTFLSNPLAGTTRRHADEGTDRAARAALLASDKDRREHALVVDAVREALSPLSASLEIPDVPSLVATSAVWHLSTEARGTLAADTDALAIAARLHPTPAVCGTPREPARALIAELEGFDRGLYAGIVGWMDGSGDGEWAVALRCAEVRGRTARLFAGAGIVEGSDPSAELAETDAKFHAMLDALGYA